MKKPLPNQPDPDPADSYLPLNSSDPDTIYSGQDLPAKRGHPVGIFISGFTAAILLIPLAYFLIIRPLSQNPVVQRMLSSSQADSKEDSLVNGAALNLEAKHPNGTVLRVNGISFDSNTTTVQLKVTNTREPHAGVIRLNQSWGSIHNTMILKDDFGEEYPLIASGANPKVEVEPGTTMTEAFTFRGRMNPSTEMVTLVTNSKGGSPTHQLLQTPLIKVAIPVNHTYP